MPSVIAPRALRLTIVGREPVEVYEWEIEAAPTTRVRMEGAMRPDTAWSQTDSRGHLHRWAVDAGTRKRPWADSLPTLIASTVHIDCDGTCPNWDCEGYDTTVYHCRLCGDVVEPGLVPDRYLRDVGELIVTGPPAAILVIDGLDLDIAEQYQCTVQGPDGETWRGPGHVLEQRRSIDRGPTTTLRVVLLDELPREAPGPLSGP